MGKCLSQMLSCMFDTTSMRLLAVPGRFWAFRSGIGTARSQGGTLTDCCPFLDSRALMCRGSFADLRSQEFPSAWEAAHLPKRRKLAGNKKPPHSSSSISTVAFSLGRRTPNYLVSKRIQRLTRARGRHVRRSTVCRRMPVQSCAVLTKHL